MATTAEQLKRLQREVAALKRQVAELRRKNDKQRTSARRRVLSENEHADEILRRAGMLSEATPEEKALVAEWEAEPKAERQRLMDEFYNLKLNKPLSDIIIENRR